MTKKRPTKEQWKQLSAFLSAAHDRSPIRVSPQLSAAGDAVLPLYSHRELRKPPTLVGSGVLVRIAEELFVFTAAHVLADFNSQSIVVGAENKLIGLVGESYRTGKPAEGDHQRDGVDAAVLRIENQLPSALQQRALTLDDLDGDPPRTNDGYLVAGYPFNASRTKGREVRSLPLLFVNGSKNPSLANPVEAESALHCFVAVGDNWVGPGGLMQPRSFRGVSGGGVWRLEPQTNPLAGKLLAIAIEHRKPADCVVGTRIGVHLGLIDRYLPGLLSRASTAVTKPAERLSL
jgi:hypothetical protein